MLKIYQTVSAFLTPSLGPEPKKEPRLDPARQGFFLVDPTFTISRRGECGFSWFWFERSFPAIAETSTAFW